MSRLHMSPTHTPQNHAFNAIDNFHLQSSPANPTGSCSPTAASLQKQRNASPQVRRSDERRAGMQILCAQN